MSSQANMRIKTTCTNHLTRLILNLVPLSLAMLMLAGCAAQGVNPYPTGDSSLAGRIKECRTGDTRVAASTSCLQDDAACYQLAGGEWCTGPRGSTCPTGSDELAVGTACPTGARCFQISEGKNCAISFK